MQMLRITKYSNFATMFAVSKVEWQSYKKYRRSLMKCLAERCNTKDEHDIQTDRSLTAYTCIMLAVARNVSRSIINQSINQCPTRLQ